MLLSTVFRDRDSCLILNSVSEVPRHTVHFDPSISHRQDIWNVLGSRCVVKIVGFKQRQLLLEILGRKTEHRRCDLLCTKASNARKMHVVSCLQVKNC